MNRWQKVGISALLSVAAVLIALACVRHRYPVLFHLSGSCACTDYSEEVEGYTVFNPFRDRSSEASANAFLENVRQGRPLVVAPDFTPADWLHLDHKPIPMEWRLRYRHNQPHHVSLYYQFTRFDDRPYQRWKSEGIAEVVEINGTWKVSSFDVIW
jgi:hypothetical protein